MNELIKEIHENIDKIDILYKHGSDCYKWLHLPYYFKNLENLIQQWKDLTIHIEAE